MRNITFLLAILIISSCKTGSSTKDFDYFYNLAKQEENPVKALKQAYKEAKIIQINQPDEKTIYYDSCNVDILNEKIRVSDGNLNINVVDLGFLNRFVEKSEAKLINTDYKIWHFLRSSYFNEMQALYAVKDEEKAIVSLANWMKIKDDRFLIVVKEQQKLLPRPKDKYVLGGIYQGSAVLFDIVDHKVICYFPFRANNVSNRFEDYDTLNIGIYNAMVRELENQIELKMKTALSEKLGLPAEQINLQY